MTLIVTQTCFLFHSENLHSQKKQGGSNEAGTPICCPLLRKAGVSICCNSLWQRGILRAKASADSSHMWLHAPQFQLFLLCHLHVRVVPQEFQERNHLKKQQLGKPQKKTAVRLVFAKGFHAKLREWRPPLGALELSSLRFGLWSFFHPWFLPKHPCWIPSLLDLCRAPHNSCNFWALFDAQLAATSCVNFSHNAAANPTALKELGSSKP